MARKINLGKFRHISGIGGSFPVFDRSYNGVFRIKSSLGFISTAYALIIRLRGFRYRRIRIWRLKFDPDTCSACSRTLWKRNFPETESCYSSTEKIQVWYQDDEKDTNNSNPKRSRRYDHRIENSELLYFESQTMTHFWSPTSKIHYTRYGERIDEISSDSNYSCLSHHYDIKFRFFP